MDSVGICGSDVHYLANGRIADFIVEEPMIIGHEASGVVVRVGKTVDNLKVGDRVAIEPGVCCRLCDYCKIGRYNLCPKIQFCATPPVNGNLTRFYAHSADFCFKLPDHVTMEEGALLEPLSVGVHACERANITLGSVVLVLGAGTIGLVTVIVAQSMGASKILIADLVESRLEVAKTLGATHTIKIDKKQSEKDMVELIKTTLGVQPDKTIDCSGAEASSRLALLATRPGGVAVMVGLGPEEVTLPLVSALAREVDIRGVFRYAHK